MLACQKHLFSLPDDLHYLNCAYMSPQLDAVEAIGVEALRKMRDPSVFVPDDFFADSHRVRAAFAQIVNVEAPERIALIPSASYGVATVARNVPLTPSQNIVLVGEQFPSNVYSWRRLHTDTGAALRIVAPPEQVEGRGACWNDRIIDAIDDATGVVAIGNVHWTDGTLFDLAAIGVRAREVGAAFIVDGTQSVGALPFDVQQIQPDALICAGYKWLFGPYSTGAAYFGPRFDDGVPIEENWITREKSEEFSKLVDYNDAYQPGAIRYDVGERSNFLLTPMFAGALEQVLAWGVPEIQAYCERLTRDLVEEARSMGYIVEDAAWRAAHLFGLRLPPHLSTDDVRAALVARNVSASVRGNAIRIAVNVFNDEADVGALRGVLAACARGSSTLAGA